MRIIAGKYKSQLIDFPKSKLVRPTTDRNKEAIFNSLNNIIDFDGVNVCDLYAGSGSLGLEALSRGAANVDFVEMDFKVSQTLKKNIEKLKAEKYCRIFNRDCLSFSNTTPIEKYDLILADPPFFKDDIHNVFKNLIANNFLSEIGTVIIERSIQTRQKDEAEFGIKAFKRLGDSLIYLFEK
ncbi:MAG: 16S rRNA (guanine(966)-N(2))-methyltransferase RsmD [Ignavibacteriales bacterium]